MDYFSRARSFRTKKKLGQNFLISGQVINSIIKYANLSKDDTVLEIGPGIGFVTEKAAPEVKRLIAVEIDKDAIDVLSDLPFNNIDIINKDILQTDFSLLVEERVKIIANIPYYITSPILVHLLGEIDEQTNKNRNLISEIILMVQYEVAKRIVATNESHSKDYGLLSILCNFWAETEVLEKVPASDFYPKPKVDSALVRLRVRETPLFKLDDPKKFRRVIKGAFAMRRKTLVNSLSSSGFSKERIKSALMELGFSENIRAENLSIEDFKNLAQKL